ncbi:MAG: sensor histidine kinase [Candidatus Omnitrophota bacterium]|jgi:NtrC-family two-component system sensor histidine kinase KinB|nr:MAG: sensor histidine kinase [Candidatus Omnitrophota bacterium]
MAEKTNDSSSINLQFVAMLIHDLESPLAVAKQFLSRVEQGRHDPDNPRHQELIEATHLAIRRAERILEDVLDIARMDMEILIPRIVFADVSTIIQKCVAMINPLANDKGIAMIPELDSFLPGQLRMDAALLERVIDNLLMNAIRNAPRNTFIRIHAHSNEISYRIEIENRLDHANAIVFENIFDPVYQVQIRKEHKLRGSGIGLTFSRQAVHAMNGSIGAKQQENGTILFWVELPLA